MLQSFFWRTNNALQDEEMQSNTPVNDVKDTFNTALKSTQLVLTNALTTTSAFVLKLQEQPTLISDLSTILKTNTNALQTKYTNTVTSLEAKTISMPGCTHYCHAPRGQVQYGTPRHKLGFGSEYGDKNPVYIRALL